MHPNIKLVISPTTDTSPGIALNDFMALPSPPPTDIGPASTANKSGKVSPGDFSDPYSHTVSIGRQPAGVKKGVQHTLVARKPALTHIGESGGNISYRRVHIIPPSGGVTGSDHRLVMLLVPVVEKIICGVDNDGLLALGEYLDEDWGDIGSQDNIEGAKIKAVFSRRGYGITKATVESGQLSLSIYKKKFSGFMKMSRPNKIDTSLESLPQWKHQQIDSTEAFSNPGISTLKAQTGYDRPKLRSSATTGNLRVGASQSPSPAYQSTKALRPSRSIADIRFRLEQTKEPKAGIQASGLSKTSKGLTLKKYLDDVARSKPGAPYLRKAISRRNPLEDPTLDLLAAKTSSPQFHPWVNTPSLNPGAPEDIQMHRAKALERALAFGEKLMEKVDLENENYIASQTTEHGGRKPIVKTALESNQNNTAGKIAKTNSTCMEKMVKGVATRSYQRTNNRQNVAPLAAHSVSRPVSSMSTHGHERNTPTTSSLMKSSGGSHTRSPIEDTEKHMCNRAGPRAATAMGTKGQASMSSPTRHLLTQRYERDIQWN